MKERVVKYTVKEICDIIGVPVPENCKDIENDLLTNVSYHLHFIAKGGALFVSGKTAQIRAERILKAIDEGVKVIFINKIFANQPELQGIPHVFVNNALDDVAKVGADIRRRKGLTVVGITGSLGKTTTKDFVFSVLSQKFSTKKSLGNQNTIYPLLNNLQKIRKDFFIQEFGMGNPTIMPRTVQACIPDAGIITNISDPHLDVYKTKENILAEKAKMLDAMPEGCPAFLNYDDELLKSLELDRPIISYAVENKNADYYVENVKSYDSYTVFDIVSGGRSTEATIYVHGTHNISNAVAGFAVGEYFGLTEEELIQGLASYKPAGVRQNLVNIGGYNLFLDCYNNAPVSLVGAVDVLSKLPVEKRGRKVAVISDIDRLGELAADKHREVGEAIAKLDFDVAFCFGNENAEIMAKAIREVGIETYYTDDRDQLDRWLEEKLTRNDVVMVKGAVIRLLSRTIDHVFGTSLQLNSEQFEYITVGKYKTKVIWEKEHLDIKTAALLKYNGNAAEPVILKKVRGTDVFSIGPACFRGNKNVKVVNVPRPITNISKGAFRGCVNLEKLSLPNTLKLIEDRAFKNCSSLKEVIIPKGVIGIGEEAFEGCSSLKDVYIPATVGQIGKDAFTGCPDVKLIYYKDSYAFKRFMQMDTKKKVKFIKRKIKNIIKK